MITLSTKFFGGANMKRTTSCFWVNVVTLVCLCSGVLLFGVQVAEATKYQVLTTTVSPSGGGTIARSPDAASYANNTDVTCTITANVGYVLQDVTLDGTSQGVVTTLTINMKADHAVTATFIVPSKTVTVTQSSHGTISPGTGSYLGNASPTFTITPDTGYQVASVTLDGSILGGVSTITIPMAYANHTLSATFSLIPTYTVTVTQASGGTISPSTFTGYGSATPSFTITPDSGRNIRDVLVDGVSKGAVATVQIPMASAGHTLTAVFGYLVYAQTVTVTQATGGVISPGTGDYAGGGAATFTITPNVGYAIENVLLDGQSKGIVTTITFNMNMSPHTLTATYRRLPTNTVTASIAGGSGTITPAGVSTVPTGSGLLLTMVPAANYTVLDVTLDGVTQGAVSTLSLNNITSDHTVSVTFARIFTIAATSGANGSISPSGSVIVAEGGNKTFTIVPAQGAYITDVKVDGSSVGVVSGYTFSSIGANHTIDITFAMYVVSMYNYCVTPPFIQSTVNPNLLLMFDNSASMYDLTYTTPSTYCYDESYNNSASYPGYFDTATVYQYTTTGNKFTPVTAVPTACTFSSAYLCVTMTGTTPNRTVSQFAATGNFLNWLTASKLDIQKLILTGGKYDGANNLLVGESRGCLGRRFVKAIPGLTGITFTIRGPYYYDPDYVSQSTQGGQTRIEIYDATFPRDNCLAAAAAWVDPHSIGSVQNITKDCIGTATAKTSVLNHIIHDCFWALTGDHKLANLNPLEGECEGIWSTYYNNDPSQIVNKLAGDAICSSSLTHPLMNGNTSGYLGKCYRNGSWNSTCAETETYDYCNGLHAFDVVDPSQENLVVGVNAIVPSFLMDAGAAGLSNLAGSFLVNVYRATPPTGLIDEFKDRISFGAMVFNQDGSGSECDASSSNITCAKHCAVDATKACFQDADCVSGSCVANSKLDGGKIISYLNYDPVGDHTSGLIQSIDAIKATTWTPYAEAYYNAIGYFGNRIDLRLNAADFDETKNPSSVSCRFNNILIISDGGSTADQNSSVNTLATRYNDGDGRTGNCSGFAGSKNLKNLTWLAKNRNIKTFITSGGSTGAPVNKNEYISTYVVFTGASDSATDVCNPQTLMTKTATNGGTTLLQAQNYTQLSQKLKDAFLKVASASSSGTAASILSNSEGSGATMLQALFFPRKTFANNTEATWTGELHNLWYYIDPFISKSTIREDTVADGRLNLVDDYVVNFRFDALQKKTMVDRYLDTNGDGVGDTLINTVDQDNVLSLWRAGESLFRRNLSASPRTIYTTKDNSTTLATLDDTNNATIAALQPYLNASSAAEAKNLISYALGTDLSYCSTTTSTRCTAAADCPTGENCQSYRSRTVTLEKPTGTFTAGTWRLGDIISSTPRILSPLPINNYSSDPPYGYKDSTYTAFVGTTAYASRNMAFAGANDGMLHAFSLGKVDVQATGMTKAAITAATGTTLGKEQWAFIPKQALPYLKYLADPNYCHLNYVDLTTTLADVSIGMTGCSDSSYSTCPKTANSWRTVLIGGMGSGGASRPLADTTCATCVKAPTTDPGDSSSSPKGLGFSSYFALDITDPNNPSLLWEFSDQKLGYSTTGPALLRIGESGKNGKWYVVIGSGPTGPIDTTSHQFKGQSEQELSYFVLDLASGAVISRDSTGAAGPMGTGIQNAFSGSLFGGAIDTDRWRTPGYTGNYSDDALYMGYVKKDDSAGTWTKGGVLRLMTYDTDLTYSGNAASWKMSKLIDDIGPVTTAIARLQDRKNKRLWLFFGSGRNYFKGSTSSTMDDCSGTQAIYGIKEPCYTTRNDLYGGNALTEPDYQSCEAAPYTLSDLTNQTSSPSSVLSILADKGWYINLLPSSTDVTNNLCKERIVTNPVSLMTGSVFFTSYKPSADPCQYGGNAYLWALKYDTGSTLSSASLYGKAIIQMSTGSFSEKSFTTDPASVFTDSTGRRTGDVDAAGNDTAMRGKPPADQPVILNRGMNQPVKKILHIQER